MSYDNKKQLEEKSYNFRGEHEGIAVYEQCGNALWMEQKITIIMTLFRPTTISNDGTSSSQESHWL